MRRVACRLVVQVLAGDLPGARPSPDRRGLREGEGKQRLEKEELPPELGMLTLSFGFEQCCCVIVFV